MPTHDPAVRQRNNRTYYESGGKTRVRAKVAEYKRRNTEYVRNIKSSTPCTDCGTSYPYYVMDFDHLRDKDRCVSALANSSASLQRVKDEIAKCEVVCANCHRIRTHGGNA